MLSRQVRRAPLLETFAQLPLCLVALEACGGAHHWARELAKLGHGVRLIAPQFVAPYRRSNKTDRNDARAICEAASRAGMRFVPVTSPEEQAVERLRALDRQLPDQDRRVEQLARVNKAVVALAAKHARILWALLRHGGDQRPQPHEKPAPLPALAGA